MEYIFVHFDANDIRDVLVYGQALGKTEEKLIIDAGYYEISLSGSGYTPAMQDVIVSATSPASPLGITFTKPAADQTKSELTSQASGKPSAGF